MGMIIKYIVIGITGLWALVFLLSIVIPKARESLWGWCFGNMKELWDMCVDAWPTKEKGVKSILAFPLIIIMLLLVGAVALAFLLITGPFIAIRESVDAPGDNLHAPQEQDNEFEHEAETVNTEQQAFYEQILASRFEVAKKDLAYDPDENEVIYYAPNPAMDVEEAILARYQQIRTSFERFGYRFVFLPKFNEELQVSLNADQITYYSPKGMAFSSQALPALSYSDIKEALKIPDKVDGPCFIRCRQSWSDPLSFSFYRIELSDNRTIMDNVVLYLQNVGSGIRYCEASDDAIRKAIEKWPADDRYSVDIDLLGQEIRERVNLLRSLGLSTLAIRKLVGEEVDNPSKLLIDRNRRVILTDFGNKEIKLEPLQKAVFFLFLRHPEGIYFKNLCDYREELKALYKEITNRDDLAGIEDSIDKVTDPLNNSINEKCARIKNAFVSEFREEIAQWYFIDGKRGEKKGIKIPRELVTWETRE